MEDVNSDKMIDRPVYSDRLRVTDVTERSIKDAVVLHDFMSQSTDLMGVGTLRRSVGIFPFSLTLNLSPTSKSNKQTNK